MATTTRSNDPAERILNTVDDLFYRQGYSSTGINQIISEAGVARASFYQHFPSKKALAVAYLRRRHTYWFARLREHVNRESNPRKRLLALFDFLDAWLPASDYRGCAFLNMVSESPAIGSEIQKVIVRHKSELRSFILELVSELRIKATEQVADTVLVLFEGAIVETQVMRDRWPIQAAREGVARLLGG